MYPSGAQPCALKFLTPLLKYWKRTKIAVKVEGRRSNVTDVYLVTCRSTVSHIPTKLHQFLMKSEIFEFCTHTHTSHLTFDACNYNICFSTTTGTQVIITDCSHTKDESPKLWAHNIDYMQFLPEHDYYTLRSGLCHCKSACRECRLPVVCNVRTSYSHRVETFGNMFSPFCSLLLSHSFNSVQKFTEIVPWEPLHRGR